MKPADHIPPSDRELDRLLGSRLKRTSPEFEQRWRELRATLGVAPRRPWFRLPSVVLWPGLAVAVLGLATVVLVLRPAPGARPAQEEEFAALIALDRALAPAAPLLETENRDAVLHFTNEIIR